MSTVSRQAPGERLAQRLARRSDVARPAREDGALFRAQERLRVSERFFLGYGLEAPDVLRSSPDEMVFLWAEPENGQATPRESTPVRRLNRRALQAAMERSVASPLGSRTARREVAGALDPVPQPTWAPSQGRSVAEVGRVSPPRVSAPERPIPESQQPVSHLPQAMAADDSARPTPSRPGRAPLDRVQDRMRGVEMSQREWVRTPVTVSESAPVLSPPLPQVEPVAAHPSSPMTPESARSALRSPVPRRARRQVGGWLGALSRTQEPVDVVQVILERADLIQSEPQIPAPVLGLVESIRKEAQKLDTQAGTRRRSSSRRPTRVAVRRVGPSRAPVPEQATYLSPVALGWSRPANGERMTRLVRRLQSLIHIAETERRRLEAQATVRMAEDSPEARAASSPIETTGERHETKVDIEALGREVLEAVVRELEVRQGRRVEDTDVRRIGWW